MTRALIPLSLLLSVSLSQPALAEGVGAGTVISNTAQASYTGPDGTTVVDSNTVDLSVDELLDVTVTSLDSGPQAAAPGQAVLTFEITNTGNGPEAFTLTANPVVAGNDFDTTVDAIAVDTNGNGTYDEGIDEILTGPATTDVLAADEPVTVFVIVTVPGDVLDTEETTVELTATAVTGSGTPGTVFAGQGESGVDAVVGATGAAATASGSLVVGITTVSLIKTADVADPFGGNTVVPGAVVTYTITANVTGSGSLSDLQVTDAFPAGTSYAPGTITLDAAPLTDASGDDAGEADASGITVDLGTVSGGTSPVVTFQVVIQ
ncbi:DUF11 domain-containing protein [Paraurantiacibacter namhicola]|uniref:DUF11 domain-containing protein n=1 Tax=Paraurantiacibacter namhicola TaxID=645517 RepID=A0A1C7DAG7_9SPHN|nr:DUF11 domain-containing protein [Paraurantiacibacter namhicola]ANU08444.1 hypothetical protein A6F65_02158 [Paraurantiacibacter namhicola]